MLVTLVTFVGCSDKLETTVVDGDTLAFISTLHGG